MEGQEDFALEGSEGREDLALGGLGISDLINSEYVHGLHLTNFCFTSSSSELRLGQIPEGRTTKAKLETPHDFRRLNPIKANGSSCRFSGAV